METKNFKVRLAFYGAANEAHYIDELSDDSKLVNLDCLYNWIHCDNEWRNLHDRIEYGFSDDLVNMDVEYKDKFINVTVTSIVPFDKHVTVLQYNKLITRTLWDWVKIAINGQLSDGIGEDSVGEYDGMEVELDALVTDEPIERGGFYFLVSDPINVIDDTVIVKSMDMPDYDSLHDGICTMPDYKYLMDEIVKLRNSGQNTNDVYAKLNGIRDRWDELELENMKYTAKKLDDMDL